eukprot:1979625-Rhodomonas_salina.2
MAAGTRGRGQVDAEGPARVKGALPKPDQSPRAVAASHRLSVLRAPTLEQTHRPLRHCIRVPNDSKHCLRSASLPSPESEQPCESVGPKGRGGLGCRCAHVIVHAVFVVLSSRLH